MSEENANKSGKGKGVIGFILALVSLILGGWIIGALYAATFSTGAAALGLLVPILGLVFSAMGMKASKAAGEKRGLAIAGLVIAIVGLIYCGIVVAGVAAADALMGGAADMLEGMEGMDMEGLNDAFGGH